MLIPKKSYWLPIVIAALCVISLTATVVFTYVHQKTELASPSFAIEEGEEAVSGYSRTVRVAVSSDYSPFTFLDENGKPNGHDIELIYEIAKTVGFRPEFIPVDRTSLKESLLNDIADLVPTFNYSASDAQLLSYTRSYYIDTVSVFAFPGTVISNDALHSLRIAVLAGSSEIDSCLEPMGLLGQLAIYNDLASAFLSVQMKENDIVVCNYSAGMSIIQKNTLDLEASEFKLDNQTLFFTVQKENSTLQQEINAAIVTLRESGKLDEIHRKWLPAFHPTLSFLSFVQDNTRFLATLILAFTVFFLLTIYMFLWMNHNREAKKARYDQLTGLPKRTLFFQNITKYLAVHPTAQLALIRTDIDRFKTFNDIYGIAAGDSVLSGIGERLILESQNKNSPYLYFSHISADSFAICMDTFKVDPNEIYGFMTGILRELVPDYVFSLRLGFVEINTDEPNLPLSLDRTLLALRSVKNDFDRHWAWFDESMAQSVEEERKINAEMESALRTGQFVPFFQPQFDAKTGKITGAEALARWIHPEKGLISPGKFVPIFESNGFIYDLDKAIWRHVCSLLREWRDRGIDIPSVSVNISRVDIYHRDLVDTLTGLISEFHLSPQDLHIEITESAYMQNPELLSSTLNALHNFGFFIEMDDFGSGYSSLSILKELPFNLIKLDMSFLRRSIRKEFDSIILTSLVELSQKLDLPVIAEGVESQEQTDKLLSIGCSVMQGYLFSKPLPVADFQQMLIEQTLQGTKPD